MLNFITRKSFLIPSFDLDAKEEEKLNRFLLVLHKSKIEELFPIRDEKCSEKGGRPSYSYYDLPSVELASEAVIVYRFIIQRDIVLL